MKENIKIGILHLCPASVIDNYIIEKHPNIIVGYKQLNNWENFQYKDKLIDKAFSPEKGDGIITMRWNDVVRKVIEESDLILTWGLSWGLELLEDFKGPIVISAHGQSDWVSKYIKYTESFATHFVAVSELSKSTFSPNIQSQVTILPNQINTDIFKPLNKLKCREELDLPADKLIIGSFGRNASYKGYQRFSDIMKLLPDCIGLVVGGEIEPSPNVICRNFHNGTMEKYLNSLDCYVSLSDQEGDSVVIKEAMACKVPCVQTPVGSAIEMKLLYNSPNIITQLYFDDLDIAKTIRHQALYGERDESHEIIKEHFSDTSKHINFIKNTYNSFYEKLI